MSQSKRVVPGWGAAIVFMLVLVLQCFASCSPKTGKADLDGLGQSGNGTGGNPERGQAGQPNDNGGSGMDRSAQGGANTAGMTTGGVLEPPPPPKALAGLKSIELTPLPPDPMLIDFPTPAIHLFQAIGAFKDGSKQDISLDVVWSVEAPEGAPISVSYGRLTVGAPGEFTVTVTNGKVSESVTVNARVQGEYNPEDLTADVLSELNDGKPAATTEIYYPLPGSLFPAGFPMPEFQVAGDASSVWMIAFESPDVDLRIYGKCSAAGDACGARPRDDVVSLLAGPSEAGDLITTIRVLSDSELTEATLDVSWTFAELTGALYYWRSQGRNAENVAHLTEIARLNLSAVSAQAEVVFGSPADTAKYPLAGNPWNDCAEPCEGRTKPCVGCHAISRDGSKLGVGLGGSNPAAFLLLDIATRDVIADHSTPCSQDKDGTGACVTGFAQFTAFSPDGERMVNTNDGKMILRTADAATDDIKTLDFGGDVADSSISMPSWRGGKFAFVGYTEQGTGHNSDLVPGGQIYIAEADEHDIDTGSARLLVSRQSGHSLFFPSVSSDGKWVVFARSDCNGTATGKDYGTEACDGYDDVSAEVFIVPAAGGTPMRLGHANGTGELTNSWPVFSPMPKAELGDKSLYWVAFSSRRPYGRRLPNADPLDVDKSKPQLWATAVLVDPSAKSIDEDPSTPPIWFPNQNIDFDTPYGNHVPQWVTRAVPMAQ
ncbi:MAG: hypothetical protein JW940_08805 [Polyangiaceae bacterium]|nr:hypothetical protein [Polyangiaceae bacterium]